MTMNLSFAGCGFLGIYHVGVVSCFKQYAPTLINKLLGASAGAIAACCLLCECPLGQFTSDALKIATTARKLSLGPFNPKFDVTRILHDRLEQILPADAHVLCSGRLYVSCTRVADGKNLVISEFASKDELIQALLCSSFIPIFSGIIPPSYRGVRYMDGCYSDNLPTLDENTITVSPFCGESDICPRDDSYNLLQVNLANTSIELSSQNLFRFMRVLFPPHPEILSQMCKQGFDDALHFLRRNDLISCTKCIAVQSFVPKTPDLPGDDASGQITIEVLPKEAEEHCTECVERKQRALLDDLPEVVLKVLEEACASMNRGIINWVFRHKSMRVLSVLTLPYVLPLDFAYVVFVKFMQLTPKIAQNMLRLTEGIFNYIRNVFSRVIGKRHILSAKFTCEVALNEPVDRDADDGYNQSPVQQLPAGPATRKTSIVDKPSSRLAMTGSVNFDFAVNMESANEPNTMSPVDSRLAPAEQNSYSRALDDCHDTFDRVLRIAREQEALLVRYYLASADSSSSSSLHTDCHRVSDEEEEDGLTPQRASDVAKISVPDCFPSDDFQTSLGQGDDDGYLLDRVVIVDSALSTCLVSE